MDFFHWINKAYRAAVERVPKQEFISDAINASI
jgi:hypothetical protein